MEGRRGGRENGLTCLMTAALNGHLAICHLLIDKGAQLEAKTRVDCTPLHFAAAEGNIEIVRLLCDRGADVEARGLFERRPLHCAAMCGHISVVKELIEERNAEINARDDLGRTALRVAGDGINADVRRNPDIAAYLISHGGIV